MEGSNQEKGSKFGSRIEISIPWTSERGPFRPKKGPKKEPLRLLGDEKGLAANPVYHGTYALRPQVEEVSDNPEPITTSFHTTGDVLDDTSTSLKSCVCGVRERQSV